MIHEEVTLTLINLTALREQGYQRLRGDTLKNWRVRILNPEIEKLERKLPGYSVLWSIEFEKFGLFVKG